MPIDFPDDPTVGEQFSVSGQTWVWTGTVWSAYRGGPVVRYGDTAPENPVDGLIWFSTSNGRTYVYFSDAWIDTTNTSAISTSVIDDSAGDAFTVTQQGAGRALVVEGSTAVTGTLNATTLQQGGTGIALSSELTGHTSATTTVHGISDTANLVYTSDARLSDVRTPTDGSVTEAKLADGAVTSTKILDGTIVNADVNASAAIAQSKIANLTADLGSKLDVTALATTPSFPVLGQVPLTGATSVTLSGLGGKNWLQVWVLGGKSANANSSLFLRFNGDETGNYYYARVGRLGTAVFSDTESPGNKFSIAAMGDSASDQMTAYMLVTAANTTGLKPVVYGAHGSGSTNNVAFAGQGFYAGSSAITSVTAVSSTGNWVGGTLYVYGS